MDMKKANPTESEEGVLTKFGMRVAQQYASGWVSGIRKLELERKFPELAGLFYDIRIDTELAREHAIPFELEPVKKSEMKFVVTEG
jgi:hypothetical protein